MNLERLKKCWEKVKENSYSGEEFLNLIAETMAKRRREHLSRVYRGRRLFRRLRDELVEKLIENRGDRCEVCGGEFTDVHHIDGDPGNNDLSNLMLVCRSCHGKLRSSWSPWPKSWREWEEG